MAVAAPAAPTKPKLTGVDRAWQEWKKRHPHGNRQDFTQSRIARQLDKGKTVRYGGYRFTPKKASKVNTAQAARRRAAGAASGLTPKRYSSTGKLDPFAGVDYRTDPVAAILYAAREHGWRDPAALLAVAFEEAGRDRTLDPRAVGDEGHSFGLFQLNDRGALGSLTPEQAFNPYTNAVVAARGGAGVGAHRLTGRDAIYRYFVGFGRGADNWGATQVAMSLYGYAKQLAAKYGL